MAIVSCKECGGEVSTTAKSCPKCGARLPRTKWWLWVPLGLVAAFVLYGASIPEYEAQARRVRSICEQMAAGIPGGQYQCDRQFELAISEGKAKSRK